MNTIREIQQINEQELRLGIAGTSASWHEKYINSPWIYIGNLDHALTEGDVICVLSQFGEIEDFNLVRDPDTGKSKGFAFCKYEDSRSSVLAVDNFSGIKLCNRSLRVDHVENYRLPKHLLEKEDQVADRTAPGHAYARKELASEYTLKRGMDLFGPASTLTSETEQNEDGIHSEVDDQLDSVDQVDDSEQSTKKRRKRELKKKEKKKHQERKYDNLDYRNETMEQQNMYYDRSIESRKIGSKLKVKKKKSKRKRRKQERRSFDDDDSTESRHRGELHSDHDASNGHNRRRVHENDNSIVQHDFGNKRSQRYDTSSDEE